MVGRWARWRIRRRLAGVAGAEEEVFHVERLRAGGWWVTTDKALYQVPNFGDPERVPFSEIRSVGRLNPGSSAIVVTAPGHQPLIGDLASDSAVAKQLREVKPDGIG